MMIKNAINDIKNYNTTGAIYRKLYFNYSAFIKRMPEDFRRNLVNTMEYYKILQKKKISKAFLKNLPLLDQWYGEELTRLDSTRLDWEHFGNPLLYT